MPIRSISARSGYCPSTVSRVSREGCYGCEFFIDGASDNRNLICTYPDAWLFTKDSQ